ncbi:MAG: hypothetical protein L7F77_13325 [Candidatus Magnetominusculus sp. LBB02]|nr:hypothetical protein [Candidatus Magnetominusculus sp. LBB02]
MTFYFITRVRDRWIPGSISALNAAEARASIENSKYPVVVIENCTKN